MENKDNCVECQCNECQTRFKIWLSETNNNEDTAEKVKQNIKNVCPVCGKH